MLRDVVEVGSNAVSCSVLQEEDSSYAVCFEQAIHMEPRKEAFGESFVQHILHMYFILIHDHQDILDWTNFLGAQSTLGLTLLHSAACIRCPCSHLRSLMMLTGKGYIIKGGVDAAVDFIEANIDKCVVPTQSFLSFPESEK